jgi:hypothetical protein
MAVEYQTQGMRQSRYGSDCGWQEWKSCNIHYYNMRKVRKRIVITTDKLRVVITPKYNFKVVYSTSSDMVAVYNDN